MNIRYPIYEGVYRILTYGRIEDIVEVELKSKKHESND